MSRKHDGLILIMKKAEPKISYNNAFPILYVNGKEAYKALNALIENSKKYIYIETFMFHNDDAGKDFADLLIKKAGEGVEIKIILDSIGARFGKGDNEMFEYLRENKINIKKYETKFITITQVNISHRKIFLSDGEILITGGMNIGSDYKYHWHDIMCEFKGQIVKEAEKEFLCEWNYISEIKRKPSLTVLKDEKYGSVGMQLLTTSSHLIKKNHSYEKFLRRYIKSAKKRIRVANCYFSSERFIRELVRAKKKGVKVDVIIPATNDSTIHKALNKATGEILSKKGCNVYLYQPAFSHVKAYIIDDTVIIGSANLDNRSFKFNQELCIAIFDKQFADEVSERIFEADIEVSKKAVEREHFKTTFFQRIFIKFLNVLDYYI